MYEVFQEKAEFNLVRAYSDVHTSWLQQEIEHSARVGDINAYLNDFNEFQNDLTLSPEDHQSISIEKAVGHHNRLRLATESAQADPALLQSSRFLGNQHFFIMMLLSGTYREQCLLQSKGRDEYLNKRLSEGPLGIDIEFATEGQLNTLFEGKLPGPDDIYADINGEQLLGETLEVNNERLALIKYSHSHPQEFAEEDSRGSDKLRYIQMRLLNLANSYVLYAAQERNGKLWRAPMMKPFSISSEFHEAYYPFAELRALGDYRIKEADGQKFSPREWLRREVLWGSLIAPDFVQLKGWLNDSEGHYLSDNFSRREKYSSIPSDKAQALAFFNHGKVIGALLSSACMLKSLVSVAPRQDDEPISPETMNLQTSAIDTALSSKRVAQKGRYFSYSSAYREARRLLLQAESNSDGILRGRRLRAASKLMLVIAQEEIDSWLDAAEQNTDNDLPELVIPKGGHPRSVGPRVEMLQPLFEQIVQSVNYQALKYS
jgi:Arc/MetJ-type ribon-helix-helix transcriptional regulator